MGETKDKNKQKISEVPEAVGKPMESVLRKKRVCGGNSLWNR